MNGKRKTTRKNFLRWSGLAFAGGLFLAGKHVSDLKTGHNESKAESSEFLVKVSRVHPARGAVVRDSV